MILKNQHRNLIKRKYKQNIYVSAFAVNDTSKASIKILYSYFTVSPFMIFSSEHSQCKSTSMKIFTLYKINDQVYNSRRKLGIKIIIQISIQEYNGRIAGVHNQIRYLNILAKPNNKQGTRLMHAQTPKFAYLDQRPYKHTMVHCGGRKVHSSFIIISPHKKTHAFRDFFLSDCQIQHSRFPLHNKSKRQEHQKQKLLFEI